MANLPEADEFPAGIYQLELTDPVLGGPPNEATKAGVDNIPHQQLAKRTTWLKARVDGLLGRTFTATGLAQGGGTGTANVVISVPVATQIEAETGTENAKAMTPLRVAQAIINRMRMRNVATSGLASGGGTLDGNITVAVTPATQAEAEAGTSNTRASTPLRVMQAIAARLGDVGLWPDVPPQSLTGASSQPAGFFSWDGGNPQSPPFGVGGALIRLLRGGQRSVGGMMAINASGNAGMNTARVAFRATSGQPDDWGPWAEAWLGQAAVENLSATGYQRLPSGLLIQWGISPAIDSNGFATITFPVAFAVAPFAIITGERTLSSAPNFSISGVGVVYDQTTTTQGRIRMVRYDGSIQPSDNCYWVAIGR